MARPAIRSSHVGAKVHKPVTGPVFHANDREGAAVVRSVTHPLAGASNLCLSPSLPLVALNHLAQFGEGEPPGEPVIIATRQEPRTPRITKGH